jgi:Fe-Mn family superoxide dismutase
MSFQLSPLPFKMDALEPVISSKTLEFHYLKHHQTYVTNLNKLTEGTEWADKSLEDIILRAEGGIFNNAAQVWNHSFYWESMHSPAKSDPAGELLSAIVKNFGSYDAFKEQFTLASLTLFGSGWAWLVKLHDGSLKILQGSNAWNPIRENMKPILTCDVWEHAYYIDYQNRRPDYVKSFFEVVNWVVVEKRMKLV